MVDLVVLKDENFKKSREILNKKVKQQAEIDKFTRISYKQRISSNFDSDRNRDFERLLSKNLLGNNILTTKDLELKSLKFYAWKKINKKLIINQRTNTEFLMKEKNIMLRAKSDFIIKLFWTFQDDDYCYFVMEYMEGGSLIEYKQLLGFKENAIRFIAAEIILGLQYMHEVMEVAYRDLKPENILVDRDGHVKLSDFGLSEIFKDKEEMSEICGTKEYLAPEMIRRDPYDFRVDFWQLGCLLYELYFNCNCFENNRNTLNPKKSDILFKKVRFPHDISYSFKSLILAFLKKDVR